VTTKEKIHAVIDSMPDSLADRLLEFLDEVMAANPEDWEIEAIEEGRKDYRNGETVSIDDVTFDDA